MSILLANEFDFLFTDGAVFKDELVQEAFFKVTYDAREPGGLAFGKALEAPVFFFAHT